MAMDPLAYELDARGAQFGLIVLSTDETLEVEARGVMARAGAGLLHARIPAAADVTPETLAQMAAEMRATAALLPEGLSAIGYGCTSGATVIGVDEVARLIGLAHKGVAVSNPISAVIAALQALKARRIAFVTPYVPEVNAPMRALLADNGIETVSEASFGVKEDRRVARISEASVAAAALKVGREAANKGGVDAVFISCTNLRSFGIIDAVEAELSLPVVSSNLALLWHLLRLGGIKTQGLGPGQLFQL